MAFTASSVRTLQASVTRRHASMTNRCLSGRSSRAGSQCTCSAHNGVCAKHAGRKQSIVPKASANVNAASTATTTPTIEEILAANAKFLKTFNCDLPAPPARKVAIVTCMDARIHPEAFMGFDIGDAHVIRNAGGRISIDALRSLVISQRMLGTKEVLVIHHTQCGKLLALNLVHCSSCPTFGQSFVILSCICRYGHPTERCCVQGETRTLVCQIIRQLAAAKFT